MTPDEIRLRSLYLFLNCSQTIEQLSTRLLEAIASSPESRRPLLVQLLKRELGLLCRYWATRRIWERLASNEADAKALNLALLQLQRERLTDHLLHPRPMAGRHRKANRVLGTRLGNQDDRDAGAAQSAEQPVGGAGNPDHARPL